MSQFRSGIAATKYQTSPQDYRAQREQIETGNAAFGSWQLPPIRGTSRSSPDVSIEGNVPKQQIAFQFALDRFYAGKTTININRTYDLKDDFKFIAFLQTLNTFYWMIDSASAFIPEQEVLVLLERNSGMLTVEIEGSLERVQHWVEFFDANFELPKTKVRWVHDVNHLESVWVKLNYRPVIQAAYPWLGMSTKDYINEYLQSDANVLILQGPPGTGKTSFIKELLHSGTGDATIAFDPGILNNDSFFAQFVGNDQQFVVIEDADHFLAARSDGNTMMHKFLNIADGLFSSKGKKIVFSTNLSNVNNIDSALLRKGRCFDVQQFRALTRVEALKVLEETKSDKILPEGDKFTLAEIFNIQPSVVKQRKIGFGG